MKVRAISVLACLLISASMGMGMPMGHVASAAPHKPGLPTAAHYVDYDGTAGVDIFSGMGGPYWILPPATVVTLLGELARVRPTPRLQGPNPVGVQGYRGFVVHLIDRRSHLQRIFRLYLGGIQEVEGYTHEIDPLLKGANVAYYLDQQRATELTLLVSGRSYMSCTIYDDVQSQITKSKGKKH